MHPKIQVEILFPFPIISLNPVHHRANRVILDRAFVTGWLAAMLPTLIDTTYMDMPLVADETDVTVDVIVVIGTADILRGAAVVSQTHYGHVFPSLHLHGFFIIIEDLIIGFEIFDSTTFRKIIEVAPLQVQQ